MSYRALITVKKLDQKGKIESRVFFKIRLDDDFRYGEELSEAIAAARTFDEGLKIGFAGDTEPCTPGRSNSDINRWCATYAEQTWCVTFCEEGGYCRVQITGKDSGGTMIFFRSKVFG